MTISERISAFAVICALVPLMLWWSVVIAVGLLLLPFVFLIRPKALKIK